MLAAVTAATTAPAATAGTAIAAAAPMQLCLCCEGYFAKFWCEKFPNWCLWNVLPVMNTTDNPTESMQGVCMCMRVGKNCVQGYTKLM